MKLRIVLYRSDEGYSVSIPSLPGCWSQGSTEEEAIANIKIAAEEYLSVVDDNHKAADDSLGDIETQEIELIV